MAAEDVRTLWIDVDTQQERHKECVPWPKKVVSNTTTTVR